MGDHYWRPISVDSILPGFPDVALYLKSGGNYVLYKNQEMKFTDRDRKRLQANRTEFLYLRRGDMEQVSSYLENHLGEILAREDLDRKAKGRMLYQSSVNYVIDVFEEPESSLNAQRCRQLVEHAMQYVAGNREALASLRSLTAHNYRIYVHSVQMMALNLLAHERLFDLSPDEMADVGIGSLLHDFGMIFIANDVARKPDAISEVEYYKLKQHTQRGFEFLERMGTFSDVVLNIVRYHHERYDGNGFPTGLKGDDIPRSAQLAALCNAYGSMVLDKPAKPGLPHKDAVKKLRDAGQEGAFNMQLLESFVELLGSGEGL